MADDLERIAAELSEALEVLRFGAPIAYVYNPLAYAWAPHRAYLRRYGRGRREVMLVGMNPGPWGMAQTGVPFGAVAPVRSWLGIEGPVDRPPREHPKRPVTGFACARQEVSGQRVWGWAQERFGTAERFFRRFFVANYCPLLFYDEAGRNLTPDKLPAADRRALYHPCDRALRRAALALGARRVIGVGTFAQGRAREALGDLPIEVGRILHPSPASPAANRGWAEAVTRELAAMGVEVPGG